MSAHILVSIDLTHMDEARSLLAEAGRRATLEGARLSIVTVLPDYGSSWVGTFFKEDAMPEALEAARVALHDLADMVLGQDVPVQCIVEVGTVYEGVLDAAERCGADLIMIGAHKPALTGRAIGPNAARIARHAVVSVLIVRSAA